MFRCIANAMLLNEKVAVIITVLPLVPINQVAQAT